MQRVSQIEILGMFANLADQKVGDMTLDRLVGRLGKKRKEGGQSLVDSSAASILRV